ncbi:MAG: hypothetical protein J2P37_09220 [Ktedonobacteraceae bacterium]|nr:hypothetical protein [Ktedonobacteraceae bacterium]
MCEGKRATLDDMAYLGAFYANQTAETRLTGDAFQQAVDRAIADMRARLSRSARQIA